MSSSLDFTLCTHAVISVANIASPSAQKSKIHTSRKLLHQINLISDIYNIAKNIFYKQEHVVVLVELGLGYYMKDANYLEMLINAKVEGLLLTHKVQFLLQTSDKYVCILHLYNFIGYYFFRK